MTAPVTATGPPTEAGRPGWYRDPWQRDALRYWDGRAWTARARPLEPVTLMTYRPIDPGTGLILTLLTCGLYAPVWMARAGVRHKVRRDRTRGGP